MYSKAKLNQSVVVIQQKVSGKSYFLICFANIIFETHPPESITPEFLLFCSFNSKMNLIIKMSSKSCHWQIPQRQHSKINIPEQKPGLWCSLQNWSCCFNLGFPSCCPVFKFMKVIFYCPSSLFSDCCYVNNKLY